MMKKPLTRDFYNRDTIQVAKDLLGKQLIRIVNQNKILSGLIVETEAYILSDPACHAYRGKTKANQALFGPVGHAYIYFIYGNHYCLNAVAHSKDQCAGGVLIRALQPLDGIDYMAKQRLGVKLQTLTNGPGKLTQACKITKSLYGHDLTKKSELFITSGITIPEEQICATTRIGISKAQENAWRFYICENPFISRA